MVYFPEREPDGRWVARQVFTKRTPHTAGFEIDGPEFDLYKDVTRFVKRQSARGTAPPTLPDPEDIEEMEDTERERLEEMIEAITLAGNAEQVREELSALSQSAKSPASCSATPRSRPRRGMRTCG